MLRRPGYVFLAVGLALAAFSTIAYAAESTLIGMVKAAPASAKEAGTFKAGGVSYKIVKDENGRKVATDANNEKVAMKGAITEKAGVKWIAVTSCKIVE